jgi:hypothetical protein
MQVDHINGNGLDNRRVNLRIATRRQNSQNRKLYTSNSSGARGVSWDQGKKRWRGTVINYTDGKRTYLFSKYFTNFHEAARETQAARLRLFPFTNEDRHPVPAA